MTTMYRRAQVADHNKLSDLWVIVDNNVYDLTKFADDHPGGWAALESVAGKDCSLEFHDLHKPTSLRLAKRFLIGAVPVEEPAHVVPFRYKTDTASSEAVAQLTPESLGLKPGDKQSWKSGGTAHMLPLERKRATFDVTKMTWLLDGGKERTRRRKFILAPGISRQIGDDKYHMDRHQLMEHHLGDFIGMHKTYTMAGFRPTQQEVPWMSAYAQNTGSLMPHFGLFLPTIIGQANMEQMMWWLPRALTFKIIGSYAQTELGHGSNVRGLQTTAHYDKETDEFLLNTPATHAATFAQLILDGKEHGVHCFMVQVRDEHHRFLPGIECGDVGPKLGDHTIDTGYMRLKNVRVPRAHMMAKRQRVTREGVYQKVKSDSDIPLYDTGDDGAAAAEEVPKEEENNGKKKKTSKMGYATMMAARAGMIAISTGKLAMACTVATRYSAVRTQGFVETKPGQSFLAPERPILDYQVQQFRLFTQIAKAYAFSFTGNWMNQRFAEIMSNASANADDLPELHASSAGLKGLCTKDTADGLEDCRKCCGGHGYLLASGVASTAADYLWQVTAEGDFVVMLLQCARFLVKSLHAVRKGEEGSGLCAYLAPCKDPSFNPLSPEARPGRLTTVEAALDPVLLLRLFKHRALIAVYSAERRLQSRLNRGESFDEAWNGCAANMLVAARCHCHYFVASKFAESMAKFTPKQCDENMKAVLRRLFCMFCLSNISGGEQWAGLLSADETSVVDDAVSGLLAQLRPDAVTLVDAFAIPDRVLNSALGRYDGNVYEHLFASAKKSELNQREVFRGYETLLRPHLDLKFLALSNQPIPEDFDDIDITEVRRRARAANAGLPKSRL